MGINNRISSWHTLAALCSSCCLSSPTCCLESCNWTSSTLDQSISHCPFSPYPSGEHFSNLSACCYQSYRGSYRKFDSDACWTCHPIAFEVPPSHQSSFLESYCSFQASFLFLSCLTYDLEASTPKPSYDLYWFLQLTVACDLGIQSIGCICSIPHRNRTLGLCCSSDCFPPPHRWGA